MKGSFETKSRNTLRKGENKKMNVEAVFTNGVGQTHSWRFNNSEEQSNKSIHQALESLTTAKLFDERGIEIFKTLEAAYAVKRTETVLFGDPFEAYPEEDEEDKIIQSFERLLPQEAPRLLTEKVDFLMKQWPAGTYLKGFQFVSLWDPEDEEEEPKVILRSMNDLL